MKRTKLFSTMMFAGALSALGTEALAAPPEAAIRYNTSPVPAGMVLIDSDTSNNANTLKAVYVKCPDTGYLLVTGTTAFGLPAGPNANRGVYYAIVKNSDSFQDPFVNSVWLNTPDPGGPVAQIPASIQRADTCEREQTVVYRFKATKAYSWQPTAWGVSPVLTVQFFKHQLVQPIINPLP